MTSQCRLLCLFRCLNWTEQHIRQRQSKLEGRFIVQAQACLVDTITFHFVSCPSIPLEMERERQKTSWNKLRKAQSAAMDYSLVLFSLIYIIKEAFFQLQLPILWPYAHLWFPLPYFPSFGFWVSKVCRHACSSSDETDITIHGFFIAFSKGEMDWWCSAVV